MFSSGPGALDCCARPAVWAAACGMPQLIPITRRVRSDMLKNRSVAFASYDRFRSVDELLAVAAALPRCAVTCDIYRRHLLCSSRPRTESRTRELRHAVFIVAVERTSGVRSGSPLACSAPYPGDPLLLPRWRSPGSGHGFPSFRNGSTAGSSHDYRFAACLYVQTAHHIASWAFPAVHPEMRVDMLPRVRREPCRRQAALTGPGISRDRPSTLCVPKRSLVFPERMALIGRHDVPALAQVASIHS